MWRPIAQALQIGYLVNPQFLTVFDPRSETGLPSERVTHAKWPRSSSHILWEPKWNEHTGAVTCWRSDAR